MAVTYLSMSENWFLWCKNVRCSIFSIPWITDAIGCFIFTFACWTTVEYYFEVKSAKRSEWQVYIMMYLTKNCLPFLNRWSVGIFKVLSINKLENIFELLTSIGKPFHYSLLSSFYYRVCTEFINTRPHFFLFINTVLYIYRVYFGKCKWCSIFIVFI